MSIGAILIGSVLLGLSIFYVTLPWVNKKNKKPLPSANKVTTTDQYEETLVALRDLDFDHTTGKITDDDYSVLRAELLVKASQALEAKKQKEQEFDSLIESAIQNRKKAKSSSQFCGKCGHIIEPSDRFCTGCGQPTKSLQQSNAEVI
jgi:rubrerythrin